MPLDRGPLRSVQQRLHARLGQIAQHTLLGIELVPVGAPRIALRQRAEPAVTMPSEPLAAHLVHARQRAPGPLPELRALAVSGAAPRHRCTVERSWR